MSFLTTSVRLLSPLVAVKDVLKVVVMIYYRGFFLKNERGIAKQFVVYQTLRMVSFTKWPSVLARLKWWITDEATKSQSWTKLKFHDHQETFVTYIKEYFNLGIRKLSQAKISHSVNGICETLVSRAQGSNRTQNGMYLFPPPPPPPPLQ